MTRADHVSGTDRVAEVAASHPAQVIVNIQGDEPMIDPCRHRRRRAFGCSTMPRRPMGTLKKRIERPGRDRRSQRRESGHRSRRQRASIFRARRFRYVRERRTTRRHFKHIGLYVYRRDFLLGYSDLPVGPLEQAERLEQLRALENGYKIRVVETEYESLGVDTPEDWSTVSELFEAHSKPGRHREQWLNTSS